MGRHDRVRPGDRPFRVALPGRAVSRLAVVLFNLGGPDSLKAVRPFLFNLFRDPAIIGLPAAARLPLAALIAFTRRKEASENYAHMGGASPLLPETVAQADALQAALDAIGRAGDEVRCFVAMRYWKPFTEATARAVAAYAPDEVVLLPLYPQYSTTTTGSSLAAWMRAYKGPGKVRTVCCYPTLDGLVQAHADNIVRTWEAAGSPEGPAPTVLRPRPAREDHRGRRSLPVAGRAHLRCGGGARHRPAGGRDRRGGLAHVLPEPGGPAEVDRPFHARGDRVPRRRRGWG